MTENEYATIAMWR